MYPTFLRVACLVGASTVLNSNAGSETPPLPPGRLEVEVEGIICECSPADRTLAHALAGRLAVVRREESGNEFDTGSAEPTQPLDAHDFMNKREVYLAAIARHLALPEALATQEECYLVFADYGVAFAEMKALGARAVRDLRQTRRFALWKRDDLLARLSAGQTIEGFTLDPASGEIEAHMGASFPLQSAKLKEAAARMKRLQRRYSYNTKIADGRATTKAHIAPKTAQASAAKREAAAATGTAFTKWPFHLREDLLLLPAEEAVDRLIDEGYRQPLVAFERMVARMGGADPNHAFMLLHETIEIGLVDAYICSDDRRWFCDGVANYLAWRVVGDLHGVERANRMYNVSEQVARYSKVREKIDLARWPAAESERESDAEWDQAHYAFATRAVSLMHERQGADILVRLLKKIAKTPRDATSMLTVERAWEELTDTSLASLLEEAVKLP